MSVNKYSTLSLHPIVSSSICQEKKKSRRSIKKQKCKPKALNTSRCLRSHSVSHKCSASLPRLSRGSSSSNNYLLSAHKVQVQNNIHFPLPVLKQGTSASLSNHPAPPQTWLNHCCDWTILICGRGLGQGKSLGFKRESIKLQHQCIWLLAAASFTTLN